MSSPDRDRLHSWKDIAAFIKCEPRTAQRYENTRALPVHRLPGGGVTKVFAYVTELQAWLDSNQQLLPEKPAAPVSNPPQQSLSRRTAILITAAVLLLASGGYALNFLFRNKTVQLGTNPQRLAETVGAKLPPLLSDGRVVYVQELTNGSFGLTAVPLSGAISKPVILPLKNPDPGVLSSDGQSFLLRGIETNKDGDQPLYRQDLSGKPPIRLGSILAYDSAWVPGQRQIIYSSLRSVYLADQNGNNPKKLFDVPGRAYAFRWSPKSNLLRFTVYDSTSSSYRIWQTDSSFSQPSPTHLGVDPTAIQCCGAWSPEGDIYYFQSLVNGFFHIFAQDARWSPFPRPAQQLTQGPSNYRSPLPLPGQDKLMVLSQTQRAELVRFDQKEQRWVPLFEGLAAATAAYSPDGTKLAFTRLPDHTLWRCDLPGCLNAIPLLAPEGRVTMPRWSPDGTRIACMIKSQNRPWRAHILAADGTGRSTPIPDPLAEADPSWSPASDQIAFGVTPNPDRRSEGEIRIFDLPSNQLRTVPNSQGLQSPSWSPDGKILAAIRADTREITLLSLVDTKPPSWTRPLRTLRAGYLNWSPKADLLYFLSDVPGGGQQITKFDLQNRKAGPAATFKGLRRPAFSFGDWTGLAPGNVPLALRDISTEEILAWPLLRN